MCLYWCWTLCPSQWCVSCGGLQSSSDSSLSVRWITEASLRSLLLSGAVREPALRPLSLYWACSPEVGVWIISRYSHSNPCMSYKLQHFRESEYNGALSFLALLFRGDIPPVKTRLESVNWAAVSYIQTTDFCCNYMLISRSPGFGTREKAVVFSVGWFYSSLPERVCMNAAALETLDALLRLKWHEILMDGIEVSYVRDWAVDQQQNTLQVPFTW